MGLADRDYMRERYRERRGLKHTTWNEKGRVELGGWFDRSDRGHDYQSGRWRSGGNASRSVWSFLTPWIVIIGLGGIAKLALDPSIRSWNTEPRPAIAFPGTGDVYVTPYADMSGKRSTFSVTVPDHDKRNYVVLLHDIQLGRDVLGIFARSGESTWVPVPAGHYRVRAASGVNWYGMEQLFGKQTRVEQVRDVMKVTPSLGSGIDFTRKIDGKLPTDPKRRSDFLDQSPYAE